MAKPSHFDLTGKRALVVGAESPAGGAVALALAEAGADVALAVLNADESVLTARKVKRDIEAMGRRSAEYVMDVTLGKNVQVTMRQVAKEMGGLEVVVGAPDLFLAKPIGKISDTELSRVMAVNFNSQFFLCRAAVSEFERNEPVEGYRGRIILLTHVLGERGVPNSSAYSAAHGAVHNLVRAMAQEVAPQGITVNGIALGWMHWHTDRLDVQDEEAARAVRFAIMKRPGEPEEVGPMAAWLAGTGTGYVTGQIFHIDGGLTQHL